MFVSCECCVFSGRGLCVGLITRPEELYRVWCPMSMIAMSRKGIEAPMESSCNTQCLRIRTLYHSRLIWNKIFSIVTARP